MNMKLSSHDFLFHRNINRRENKAQIPLIIHCNENFFIIIYFWCVSKNNWGLQISEVALRKELEQLKFPFPSSGHFLLRIDNQNKILRNCLEEDVCLYRPNARWEGEFEWLKTLQGPQLESCGERLHFAKYTLLIRPMKAHTRWNALYKELFSGVNKRNTLPKIKIDLNWEMRSNYFFKICFQKMSPLILIIVMWKKTNISCYISLPRTVEEFKFDKLWI